MLCNANPRIIIKKNFKIKKKKKKKHQKENGHKEY